jgi:hypothetical protein
MAQVSPPFVVCRMMPWFPSSPMIQPFCPTNFTFLRFAPVSHFHSLPCAHPRDTSRSIGRTAPQTQKGLPGPLEAHFALRNILVRLSLPNTLLNPPRLIEIDSIVSQPIGFVKRGISFSGNMAKKEA